MRHGGDDAASMRPPEFTGGNIVVVNLNIPPVPPRFNEAAGIHRRKRGEGRAGRQQDREASMRPPEFTGGNLGGAADAQRTP